MGLGLSRTRSAGSGCFALCVRCCAPQNWPGRKRCRVFVASAFLVGHRMCTEHAMYQYESDQVPARDKDER